jgi:hypothetical protein
MTLIVAILVIAERFPGTMLEVQGPVGRLFKPGSEES